MQAIPLLPGSEDPDPEEKPKKPRLTASQLQRKRELDRDAQRSNRARTKSRIAHLESLVSILQAPEATSDRTNELIAQVNNQKVQIDKLLDAISGISKIVSSTKDCETVLQTEGNSDYIVPSILPEQHLGEPQHPVIEDVVDKLERPHPLRVSSLDSQTLSSLREGLTGYRTHRGSHLSDGDSLHIGSGTSTSPEDLNHERIRQLTRGQRKRETQIIRQGPQRTAGGKDRVSQIASEILENCTLDGRLWYLAGTILQVILDKPDQHLTPSEYGEDIAVRAVLRGWASTASHYDLDAGWQWLRHLDEALYSSLGLPERLSILRMMRLQYLAQVDPESKHLLPLPAFLKARPAQIHIDHDPLVEHFVWPGLREHLLFSPRKYATNTFMEEFRNQCTFMWPFEPEKTFMRNTVTGLYSYSPEFILRQKDLRCWTMRPDFFHKFPELRPDIPSFSPPLLNAGLVLSLPTSNVRSSNTNIFGKATTVTDRDDEMDGLICPFGQSPVTGQVGPLEVVGPDWGPTMA
ncbi:hypothetical protein LTR84_005155 [Exophiala bonariae]|uniref:BHLH domain-containing protein n=1 Tax=Exophiala bonariae TaxID=1690606 RepID=A0AAV9NSG5_9EURO|nr:hypothetical protein LTR84_005155 [Exophiala bonariae]